MIISFLCFVMFYNTVIPSFISNMLQYKGAYKNTNPQDMDYSLLLEDEDNLDASPSEPIEITLPRNMDGT